MFEREVYWVVPVHGRWQVNKQGQPAIADYLTKQMAVHDATKLATRAQMGLVKVQRQDGSIEEEISYGEDPREVPG